MARTGQDLRARICTGMYTLPFMAGLTAVVWMAPDVADWRRWAGLVTTGWITYLLIELNNRNALLRVRSRMVSSSFLAMMAAFPALQAWTPAHLAPLCLAASLIPLFRAYQKPAAAPDVFRAFCLTGLGSLLYPPLVCLLPCYFLVLQIHLRALSGRTFAAGLLGAALPYWLLAVVALWRGDLTEWAEQWAAAFRFPLPDFRTVTPVQLGQCAFLTLLTLLSAAHFVRTAYNDKIRTRMFFYILLVIDTVLLAGLCARPQDFSVTGGLLAVGASPLIGRYFTLARGRWMNAWFYIWTVLLAALAVISRLYGWTP